MRLLRLLITLFGIGVVVLGIASLTTRGKSVTLPQLSKATGVPTRNKANALLLQKDATLQAESLALMVGEGCLGRTAFYQGMVKSGFGKDSAIWSLRCSDGREFSLMIEPDAEGTTTHMLCGELVAFNAGHCFERDKQ